MNAPHAHLASGKASIMLRLSLLPRPPPWPRLGSCGTLTNASLKAIFTDVHTIANVWAGTGRGSRELCRDVSEVPSAGKESAHDLCTGLLSRRLRLRRNISGWHTRLLPARP
jgi:hypothetical protein